MVRNSTSDTEIYNLKHAKLALETKLRKYAAHCQRLEGEKISVLEKVKSILPEEDDFQEFDDDLLSAVIHLYDRMKNIEEECSALASAEKKASGYLMEVDRLQDDNATLEERNTIMDKILIPR